MGKACIVPPAGGGSFHQIDGARGFNGAGLQRRSRVLDYELVMWNRSSPYYTRGHYRRCGGESLGAERASKIFGEVTVLPGDSNGLNWPTKSLPP